MTFSNRLSGSLLKSQLGPLHLIRWGLKVSRALMAWWNHVTAPIEWASLCNFRFLTVYCRPEDPSHDIYFFGSGVATGMVNVQGSVLAGCIQLVRYWLDSMWLYSAASNIMIICTQMKPIPSFLFLMYNFLLVRKPRSAGSISMWAKSLLLMIFDRMASVRCPFCS
jgi:hypothetical protein